jgi:predicted nucleotidyltransferase
MTAALEIDSARLGALCRRYHVAKLEMFGSRARGTARADSDADLLVTFEPGRTPSLLAPDGYMALMDELESLMGCRVDLLTRATVEADPNEYFRGSALGQTEILYKDHDG